MRCPINFNDCKADGCIFWVIMKDNSGHCAFELAKKGMDEFVTELIENAREFDKTPLGQGLIKVVRNFLKK
jgi:hypothetical protein